MSLPVFIPNEIQEALNDNQPLVALETTVISHGLPHPYNLDVTQDMIQNIRTKGAIPVVIGLMDGQIKIGLNDSEIERFAIESSIQKVNLSNLSLCLQQKALGATTVAATSFCANLAGIKVFATGGIGGVHREADKTFDISNDLVALSKTPTLVVASGAKSILDIPKTLEYLETFGIPVLGYQTNCLPLFYTAKSQYPIPQMDTPQNVSEYCKLHWQLKLGGILLANPIPEENALDETSLENTIQQALAACQAKKITGKAVTPFLLNTIVEQTQGASLQANNALLRNNALCAAEIAVCFST